MNDTEPTLNYTTLLEQRNRLRAAVLAARSMALEYAESSTDPQIDLSQNLSFRREVFATFIEESEPMRGPTSYQTAQNILDDAARKGIAAASRQSLPSIIDSLVDVTGRVAGCWANWNRDRVGAIDRLEYEAKALRELADQVERVARE